MLPSSHPIPMNVALGAAPTPEGHLSDAFTAFMTAASRLENSYGSLQDEVARLRRELEERNASLAASLATNRDLSIALHRILEALPCGVAVVESSSRAVALINPEARRMLGIPADKTIRWDDFPTRIRTLVDSPGAMESREQEICLKKDGNKQWVAVRSSAIVGGGSQLNGAGDRAGSRTVLILRDVTAQKEAENEREANRNIVALAEMATVLAHEIRNPLGSLELFARLLVEEPSLGEGAKEWISNIQAGVRSLSATVNNVLSFYSLGIPHFVRVNLASVLASEMEFVKPLAEQKAVKVRLEETLGETELRADPNGLQQVLLNLVCNALRHTSPGGNITVTAKVEKKESARAVVEFRDDGKGIKPEDLLHIFEPGFSTTGQSPGLGLTVCRRIVEQHGGTISAQSTLNQGATFRMEFPVA
jgi:signal transduction histidine kinase